jgi:hypothetical protein
MDQVKKLITEQAEEETTKVILEQVRKHNMTIFNLIDVTGKVINYMTLNAVLVEDSVVTESPLVKC